MVRLCQRPQKGSVDVGAHLGRDLKEAAHGVLVHEGLPLLGRHRLLHSRLDLVANQNADGAGVGVLHHLFSPPFQVVKRFAVGAVVHEHHAHRPAVVRGRNGPVALLPRRVPDLPLDLLAVDLVDLRRELHPDRRLGLLVVLVARLAAQHVGLARLRIADHDHLE